MNILVTTDYFLPGTKAGGAVRSLANLVEALGDEIDFRVLTRDRDAGDPFAYPGIDADRWQRVGKAQVCYLSPRSNSLAGWRSLLQTTPHDVLYLNSYFSPSFTLKPLLLRRLGLVPRRSVVLSPRGELAPSALAIKGRKKRLFAPAARAIALYRDVIWQASSEYEAADIVRHGIDSCSGTAGPFVVPDLSAPIPRQPPAPAKTPGSLTIAFLSRVVRVKNLDGALTTLAGVSGDVEFNIYGPLEDPGYWRQCQDLIATLPSNVRASYRGAVPSDEVPSILCRHHLFFLPTKGENYGHAIVEALASGCPVLIGDQTPWRNLAKHGAGWDLPLDRPDLFREVLQRCVEMDQLDYHRLSQGARVYYERILDEDRSLTLHRELFLRASQHSAECQAVGFEQKAV